MFTYGKKILYILLVFSIFPVASQSQIKDYLKSFVAGYNEAAFVSQNIPAVLRPGETKTVSVTVRNTGLSTWEPGENYQLLIHTESDNVYSTDVWSTRAVTVPFRVESGDEVTFNFNITAPSAPGRYNFQWTMARNYDAFGEKTPIASVNVVDDRNPYYRPDTYGDRPPYSAVHNASYVSQSVPNVMYTGEKYSVTVSMTNTGTAVWYPGYSAGVYNDYKLVAVNDPSHGMYSDWSTSPVTLTRPVGPGETAHFMFDVFAPQTPGMYTFQWTMANGTTAFGERTPAVTVDVQGRMPDDRYQSRTPGTIRNSASYVETIVPTSMSTNSVYTVYITMRNTGSNVWTMGNYELGYVDVNDMDYIGNPWSTSNPWGVDQIDLQQNVYPGESVTFKFNVISPSIAGIYDFMWRMEHNGVPFGDMSARTKIAVRN